MSEYEIGFVERGDESPLQIPTLNTLYMINLVLKNINDYDPNEIA
jgi:hypothetical protein